MPNPIDLTGRTFGRLTVLGLSVERIHGRRSWDCRCSCGVLVPASGLDLNRGDKKSCGCMRRDKALGRERAKTRIARHGLDQLRQARAAVSDANLMRGESHYLAKLTPALVREARILAAGGTSLREIVERLGLVIDPSTVWLAVNRKTWKSVEWPAVPW